MHVLATAGHVDHGKSTLVRALTGMEPDRWAEERRRGMTIDLGFAWTTLPSGADVALVDVPGHARFVGNMLAGAGPVPAALFVVAADAGWQPQSTEHLAALDAFGVRHGVLAVTRSDLADPRAAAGDALQRIAASSLGVVEAVAVSAPTGRGLAALCAALERLVVRLPLPDTTAPVRLWVDRAFTIRGAGTVVTGTLPAGTLRVGDELLLAPTGRRVRVRGLESLKRRSEVVPAVARVAVNLRGVERDDVRRGQALVTPGGWLAPAEVDARLSVPPAELPAELLLHVGSAAVSARVRPLGADTARIRLAAPLPLRIGDRGLLRDPGRHDLVAGLTVLDVDPPSLRRRGSGAARARALAAVRSADPAGEVDRRGAVRRTTLVAMGVLAPDAPAPVGAVVAGEWLVAERQWRAWVGALTEAVDEAARRAPLEPGLPAEAARHALGLPDPRLLAPLAAAAGLTAEQGRLRRPGAATTLPPPAAIAVQTLRGRLAADPFAAAEAAELSAAGLTQPLLAVAVRAGLLDRVADGVWLLPGWPDVAVERLAALPQPFTTSQARQALGTTRRVAVPVLEALDAARRTRRLDGTTRTVVRAELREVRR